MTLLILAVILVGGFVMLSVAPRLGLLRSLSVARRGQIALAFVFLFTGAGHFAQTDQMAQMLPPWVPARGFVVLASGVVEWLLAGALMVGKYPRLVGMSVIAFLVLVFPGNVYAAINRVDFGGHGAGPAYLLIRAPFQLFLIAWAYWFAVRLPRQSPAAQNRGQSG